MKCKQCAELRAEIKDAYAIRELAFRNWDSKVERADKILEQNRKLVSALKRIAIITSPQHNHHENIKETAEDAIADAGGKR